MTALPKALIFDFDGVILESADIKTEAFLDLFSGYPQHRDAILRHHLDNQGISRYRKFEWIYTELLGIPLSEEESRRLGEVFSQLVMSRILQCEFVPGARECLQAFAGRTKLFVASGTPQEELELIIERRGLRAFFVEVWGTPLEKGAIIRSILNRYGLEQEDVVLIGDGISDFHAARETGIAFLARGRGQHEGWRDLGATVFPDLEAIRLHLDGAAAGEAV